MSRKWLFRGMEIRGGKNKGGVRRDTKGQGRGLMFCVSSFIK